MSVEMLSKRNKCFILLGRNISNDLHLPAHSI